MVISRWHRAKCGDKLLRWVDLEGSEASGHQISANQIGNEMDVSKNRGKHPKWMVYNGKPYILKWMIWGYHYF